MAALLLAFVACLAAEWGDKSQTLCARLADRDGPRATHYMALLVVACGVAAASATVGALLAPYLGLDARFLYLALGFLMAGVASLWPLRPRASFTERLSSPFLAMVTGLVLTMTGGGSAMLISGIAMSRGYPVLAAAGGALGMVVACWPAILLGGRFTAAPAVRIVRRSAGALFLCAGCLMALRAVGLY